MRASADEAAAAMFATRVRDVPRRRRQGRRPGRREPQPEAAQLHRCRVAGERHRRARSRRSILEGGQAVGKSADDARPAAARRQARGARRAREDHPRVRQEVTRTLATSRSTGSGPTIRRGRDVVARSRARCRAAGRSARARERRHRRRARRPARRRCAVHRPRAESRASTCTSRRTSTASRASISRRRCTLAAITGPRLVLIARRQEARRRSCAPRPRAVGCRRSIRAAPVEFAVGLERNQVLLGAAARSSRSGTRCRAGRCCASSSSCRPPPRTVGAAQGHLWVDAPRQRRGVRLPALRRPPVPPLRRRAGRGRRSVTRRRR